jgi:hypothetical protein
VEPSTTHEWLYRASTSKEGLEDTRALARDLGFIHRNAFADAVKEQMIPHVGQIAFGDLIHLYFVDAAGGTSLGSYRVVGPNKHPRPELFAAAVTGASTLRRAAGELADHLRTLDGYTPDPRLAAHCGWPVVPDERPSPIYAASLFPGRNSIAPYGGTPKRKR